MLGKNIRDLRKLKGFTQEELAVRLNVVRQTVSKWEKGLSVPDAETLQRIADILEISVDQLLGADIKNEDDNNEIAQQLSRINEQLSQKNKRSKLVLKVIGIIVAIIVFLNLLFIIIGVTLFTARVERSENVINENNALCIETLYRYN